VGDDGVDIVDGGDTHFRKNTNSVCKKTTESKLKRGGGKERHINPCSENSIKWESIIG